MRRIDFSGNLTRRDKVIRRELLIDEGDIFNNRLWELSLLRLNQLGYFEPLKPEEAADMKRDTKTNTVDITFGGTANGAFLRGYCLGRGGACGRSEAGGEALAQCGRERPPCSLMRSWPSTSASSKEPCKSSAPT